MTKIKNEGDFKELKRHCEFRGGYYYLASPYTSPDPVTRARRYSLSLNAMHTLMWQGIVVFGPIIHTHPIADKYDLPKHHGFWEKFDRPFLNNSIGMILLMIDGWRESKGMKYEYKMMLDMYRGREDEYPIYCMPSFTFDSEEGWQLFKLHKDYSVGFEN